MQTLKPPESIMSPMDASRSGPLGARAIGVSAALILMAWAAASPAEAATTDVTIVGFTYTPNPVTLTRGDLIRWTNQDAAPHTVTADSGAFNSGNMNQGTAYTLDTTALDPGSYPYTCLYHANMRGTVTIQAGANTAPSAAFVVSAQGLRITVDATGSTDPDGTITAYTWNWGDGTPAGSGRHATHTYASAATYTITLTVTDNAAATGTTTRSVTVQNLPPTADFTYTPASPTTGSDITFTSTATDADGTIATSQWSDGGSGSWTGTTFTHRFPTPGAATITQTVTDNTGATATASKVINVANRPPAPSFTFSPTAPMAGENVTFTDTSTDPDDGILSWAWDFHDGGTSGIQHPTHVFTSPNNHVVTLTVTDGSGATGSVEHTVPVAPNGTTPPPPDSNQPPVARFTLGARNLTVSTNASTSSDPDGIITTYTWDWGDGSPANVGNVATHTYHAAGTYVVTLRVTDDDGDVAVAEETVTLKAANLAPVAAFIHEVDGLRVHVDASPSTDGDGRIVDHVWKWGDGSDPATGVTASHTYGTAGTYDVRLLVRDDDGAISLAKAPITVTAPRSEDDMGTRDHGTGGRSNTTGDAPGGRDNAPGDDDDDAKGAARLPPSALFTASVEGSSVNFNGTASTGRGLRYAWEFGDGAVGEGAAVSHTYAAPGSYAVRLGIVDEDGAAAAVDQWVTVASGGTDPGPAAGNGVAHAPAGNPIPVGWGVAALAVAGLLRRHRRGPP